MRHRKRTYAELREILIDDSREREKALRELLAMVRAEERSRTLDSLAGRRAEAERIER